MQITRLAAHYVKIPEKGIFTRGRLERIELSIPVPQTGVLPLNYSRHKPLVLMFIMMYKVVAIVT